MEVFIYTMRMIMLVFSLQLIGHNYLDPIFVSMCGLAQSWSVIYKSMKGKKKFYKLTTDDIGKGMESEAIILSPENFEE